MKKMRIDDLLVNLRFADSRAKAQALVMAGEVLVDEQRIEKPSQRFAESSFIRLKSESTKLKYVGRGGLKLEKALTEFNIRPNEYVCLDVGASTGGFTDCLLQNGAKRVYAVDAGTNQLVWKLRNDARVEVMENVNARYLKYEDFNENFDLIVMDVSFISVTKIIPMIRELMTENGKLIILIKPQFEVAKEDVEVGGIVVSAEKHRQVIEKINVFAEQLSLKFLRAVDSPILGASGNKEFLALYERADKKR